jgi:hypothetical protein
MNIFQAPPPESGPKWLVAGTLVYIMSIFQTGRFCVFKLILNVL